MEEVMKEVKKIKGLKEKLRLMRKEVGEKIREQGRLMREEMEELRRKFKTG